MRVGLQSGSTTIGSRPSNWYLGLSTRPLYSSLSKPFSLKLTGRPISELTNILFQSLQSCNSFGLNCIIIFMRTMELGCGSAYRISQTYFIYKKPCSRPKNSTETGWDKNALQQISQLKLTHMEPLQGPRMRSPNHRAFCSPSC